MKHRMEMLFIALAVLTAGAVPAFAAQVGNPSTGDNSMVTVALIIMAIAAVVIVTLLFVTKKRK